MPHQSKALARKLAAALAQRGPHYHPRTRHLLPDGSPRYTNRLILEDSPYLLQHAHNPVDWFPWGEEAFATARRENKPVFLSIGYATCHWCHVMEKESFEDEDIARYINQHFIAIKVDRERRPDVDATYMAAVMLMRGNGGWPMSSFLTPDGKPFYGGTYFPPQQFLALLNKISAAWGTQRKELTAFAEKLADAVRETTAARATAAAVGQSAIEAAQAQIVERWAAADQSGIAGPLFPNEPELLFLLARAKRGGHGDLLQAARTHLDSMMRGGIYDQIGGGFHRYATDGQWRIPHFEKMLYNQAHLARAYGEAYALTGDVLYARVARQTLDYELREMAAPGGGFYSASDADSSEGEGTFFVWSPKQVADVLGVKEGTWLAAVLGITDPGNFEGRSIPYLPRDLGEVGGDHLQATLQRLDRDRAALLKVRDTRVHPDRDAKIVTAWNGMLITTLAQAAALLDRPRYREVALETANFLWQHNQHDDGKLYRVTPQLQGPLPAAQEDYAYFAQACIALYDVTQDRVWLSRAEMLVQHMLTGFQDKEHGGFFMGEAHAAAIARPKDGNDGAIPSGNAIALDVLAKLYQRTGKPEYEGIAQQTLNAFSGDIQRNAGAFATMLQAADDLFNGEPGRLQYAAKGVVRAEATRTASGVEVTLAIRDGWHIQAHEVSAEEFIATQLGLAGDAGGWTLTNVSYPKAVRVRLGFADDLLNVYQGRVKIGGLLKRTGKSAPGPTLTLRVQACNDKICLLPETLRFRFPLRQAK